MPYTSCSRPLHRACINSGNTQSMNSWRSFAINTLSTSDNVMQLCGPDRDRVMLTIHFVYGRLARHYETLRDTTIFTRPSKEDCIITQHTLNFFCSFTVPSSEADLTGVGGRVGTDRAASSLSACATPSPTSLPCVSPTLADPTARDAGLGGRRTGRRGGSAMAWPFDDCPLPGGNQDEERMEKVSTPTPTPFDSGRAALLGTEQNRK